jgi:long-chain fatty acid transport protein
MGYSVGAAYSLNDLTLGAVYKSAIDMEYKGQISRAMFDFGMTGTDNLEQPAEMGIGASYTMDGHTLAVDYKKIKWADAKGYKDFGWDDQNVYIIGYQYAQEDWAVRAGWNHSKSPIKELTGSANAQKINMFNLLGFPAIVEDHYTVGGTYAFSKMTSLDLAYVYVPEIQKHLSLQLRLEGQQLLNTVKMQLAYNLTSTSNDIFSPIGRDSQSIHSFLR